MSHHLPRNAIRFLTVILSVLPLLTQMPAGIRAAPPDPEGVVLPLQDAAQVAPVVSGSPVTMAPSQTDCSATTCPGQATGFSGLDKCVERTDFCVYYTTASVSETEAEWAADQVQDYWDRYVALGFNEPKHSGKLEVYLENTSGCNGGTGWSINYMTTYAGCWDDGDDVVQMTLGHELQHRVQYNYDTSAGAPVQTKFLKEGTARAGQDNWFTNIDHMPGGAAGFTYCAEAASYLAFPNSDLSSHWYKSCVWWKWAAEQYGTTLTEPERGVDFFETVYDQNTLGYSSIAAVNQALNIKAPGTSFNDSFKKFAVAAYTKDLSGMPDDSYNILDEDEVGSPGICGSVPVDDQGAIQVGTDRQWNNQTISRYGMRYYEADVGATCPVISASFHRDSGPAFYHIVTQDGSTFKTHKQGSGTDWSQSFLNDGVSKVVAIVGSLDSSAQVDVTLGCADPTVDIQLPNQMAPEYVGPFGAPGKFVAQVLVTNGSPTAPVVAGMTNSDFKAEVGGIPALVIGGGFVQEEYFLQIQAPAQAANGPYDLEIFLEEPGTSTVLDSDTETDAVIYDSSATDHVLIIDRSDSMDYPVDNPPIAAAKAAANLFIDVMNSAEGLSVVAYNHDIDPAPLDMDFATLPHRNDAEAFVNGISEGTGATSIGDGLNEAFRQRTITSTTDNERCLFTLLSDGMENSSLYWSDVSADVIGTGCPVMSIAFGPYSDETLMQNIASATGGLYFYNDVYESARIAGAAQFSADDMALDLGSIYEYAQGRGERRQRLLAEKGIVPFPVVTQTHAVSIDNSISDVLFTLDWNRYIRLGMELKLRKPDGSVIDSSVLPYTFSDTMTSLHVGWRIPDPDPGLWEMLVTQPGTFQDDLPYQVLVSGKSNLTALLLLPDQVGLGYFTGNLLPIYAFLSSNQPILGANVVAQVMAPNNLLGNVTLFDDGEHGDGAANDGMYGGTYGPINQATPMTPTQEPGVPAPPSPNDEGSYRVRLLARGADYQREALGAFSVLEGDDADGDGLPDTYEDEYDISDPGGDPDVDLLNNSDEYYAGTDPTNSDTDGGGENDWSEVNHPLGLDPLDPSDDEIEALDFFHTEPISGGHVLLTYDVKAEYAEMVLYRATNPDGPWVPQTESPTGAFTDTTVMTGTTYYYLLLGKDGDATPHWSALSSGEPVTPSLDPVPPQAFVLINEGASSTDSQSVTLSFEPYEYEPGDPNGFDDITHALISNDPTFAGASWQAIDPHGTVGWQLGANPGEIANVYVRFRDENDNESANPEVGMILYDPNPVYLPVVLRDAS